MRASGSPSEYPIGRPTGVCAATGAALSPGQAYIGALVPAEPEGEDAPVLERRDYALEAWGSLEPKPAVFARWRGVVPQADAKPTLALDPPALYDLLDQLGENEDESRRTLRYVLALLLMRKRLLTHVGTRRDGDGRDVILVRRKGDDPESQPVEIADPSLEPQALSTAAAQLASAIGLEP